MGPDRNIPRRSPLDSLSCSEEIVAAVDPLKRTVVAGFYSVLHYDDWGCQDSSIRQGPVPQWDSPAFRKVLQEIQHPGTYAVRTGPDDKTYHLGMG